jgi:hypothetical protein
MSIRGMTPSSIGETGPPVVGRADAEAVALAVGLAVAVALMLADAVGLAVAVALMLADALLLADALDIALGLDAAEADALGLIIAEADALGLIIAEAEALGLDIMLLPIICELLIICPLGIMCIPFICCAIATAAKANTATTHRDANKRNFLKIPPSVDLPLPGSTCTFPRGSMIGRPQSHRQCAYQDPVVTSESVGASEFGGCWGPYEHPPNRSERLQSPLRASLVLRFRQRCPASGRTCPYTESVMLTSAWPASSDTILMGTPRASNNEMQECRRS